MATLSEILAKRNSRKGGSATASDVTPAFEVVGGGPKIRADEEREKLAANIKQTLDASSPKLPKAQPPAPQRELGATETGERLPMDHPQQGAPESEWNWFNALHSVSSDMGIVIEPEGDHAWLAVNAHPLESPLLILRLPLLNRRLPGEPF